MLSGLTCVTDDAVLAFYFRAATNCKVCYDFKYPPIYFLTAQLLNSVICFLLHFNKQWTFSRC